MAESQVDSRRVEDCYGIGGDRDQEDDESCRYRINLHIRSRKSANEDALRFELLKIPGIQDVVFERKAGTFNVYVYAITPLAAASLLQDVQTRINDVAAFPITGLALNPDLVGISLVSTLRVSGAPTQVDQQIIISAATNAAANYINNLRIDEALIINEIADRIRAADPRIIDVGDPNHPIPEIYIWRSRNDGTRWSRSLVANYTPAVGERIVHINAPSENSSQTWYLASRVPFIRLVSTEQYNQADIFSFLDRHLLYGAPYSIGSFCFGTDDSPGRGRFGRDTRTGSYTCPDYFDGW